MTHARKSALLQAVTIVGGAACALLFVAAIRGPALPFSRPAPLEGYVVEHGAGVTVYAPSATDARQGWREVADARERFRTRFGTRPVGLVVVLADDPAQFTHLDTRPLRRAGAGFLPFITRAHLDSYASASDLLVLDDGSALQAVDGAVQVVARTATPRRAGVDIRAGDVVQALGGVPVAGLDDLAARFHAIPVGGTVRLQLLRARKPVSLAYIRAQADTAAERAYRAAFRPLTQVSPLAHEACHVFVAALVDDVPGVPGQPGASYGHPALPDWLDEAAATQCESTRSRAVRRRHLVARLDDHVPVRRFTQMDHPLAKPVVVAVQAPASSPPSGYVVEVSADARSKQQVLSTGTVLFYSQALSLGEFLVERGGPGALRGLLHPLSRGRTLDQALRQVHPSSPGLPGNVDQLETEWLRWVEHGGGS